MPKKPKLIKIKCQACTDEKACLYDKWGCPAVEYARSVLDGTDRDDKEIITCKWVKLACERFVDDLKNGGKRGLYFDIRAAMHVLEFFGHLKLWKGKNYKGKEFALAPHYQFIISNLMGWKKSEDHMRRFGVGYIEMGRKGAKALALDTPVPTPDGWTTIGDIESGDTVFDERGSQCNVVSTTETLYDHECYEVVFSDGTKITTDKGHLWKTESRRTGRPCPKDMKGVPMKYWPVTEDDKIHTTEEILKTLSVDSPYNIKYDRIEWNHKIVTAGSMYNKKRDYPIPPYVLGCWLGDGNTATAQYTINWDDKQIIDEIKKCGVSVKTKRKQKGSRNTYRVLLGGKYKNGVCMRGHPRDIHSTIQKNGDIRCLLCARTTDRARRVGLPIPPYTEISLHEKLRNIGVLGNKHIPEDYLWGSYQQRLDLLQGLMDSDGTISKAGKCEFASVKEKLAIQVKELVASLGLKPSIRIGKAACNGKDCGVYYRVAFWAYRDTPVFKLKRKLNRQKPIPKRVTRVGFRQIVAVNKIKSVPVKCVSVNSDSKLFLVSKSFIPTHNSTVAGGIAAYFFVADFEWGAEIYTAAVKEKQAKIVWENIYNLLKGSMFEKDVEFYKQNMSIEASMSRCEFVVGDPKGLDGLDIHFCSLDELHAHPTPEVHDLIVDSVGARPQPMILIITTAGFDQSGVCYQRREYLTKILKGYNKGHNDDSLFGIIYTLDTKKDWPGLASITSKSKTKTKEDDWTDEDLWVKAMPGLWGITKSRKKYGIDKNGDQVPGYMTKLSIVQQAALYAASNPAALNNFTTKRLNIWSQQLSRWIDLTLWDSNHTSDVYIMEQ